MIFVFDWLLIVFLALCSCVSGSMTVSTERKLLPPKQQNAASKRPSRDLIQQPQQEEEVKEIQKNSTPFLQNLLESYSNALENHPFVTKGTTCFILCGLSDVIAQSMTEEGGYQNIDQLRTGKFAAKGFVGAGVWDPWYGFSERLLSRQNVIAILSSLKMMPPSSSQKHVRQVQVLLSIALEQFVGSPLYYVGYEIPVATIMNGGSFSRILYNIQNNLMDMLIANALVWTGANYLIYNAPLEYRMVVCSLFTLLWQIIMSTFAAKCG